MILTGIPSVRLPAAVEIIPAHRSPRAWLVDMGHPQDANKAIGKYFALNVSRRFAEIFPPGS
jgi:hypothetical protein